MPAPVRAEAQKAATQQPAKRASEQDRAARGPSPSLHQDILTLGRPMSRHGAPLQPQAVLNLQRTIGNRATGRLLQRFSTPVQAKLSVGKVGDVYEREADAAADRVAAGEPVQRISRIFAGVLGPASQRQSEPGEEEEAQLAPVRRQQTEEEEPVQMQEVVGEEERVQAAPVQRMCAACEQEAQREGAEEEEQTAQTKAGKDGGGLDTAAAEQAMTRSGAGNPLAPDLQGDMEASFGADFSGVRVHTGPAAHDASRAIQARAFTRGTDIYLGRGENARDTRLMAHELTHVLQQTGDGGPAAVRASAVSSLVVQRQCTGNVGDPASYASRAAPHLRCDHRNTGIADVTARITAGRQKARVMIDDALTVLNRMLADRSASTNALNHFRRLFRLSAPQPTNGQIRLAIAVYNQICAWLTSPIATAGGGILCLTQGAGQCRGGRVLGSAACATMGPINLCPDGISTSSQATAETIIHEAAHRFGVCTRPPAGSPPGTPAPPERYEGQAGFPTSPALRTSADSYNAFAREAHGLRTSERRAERLLQEEESGMTERPIPSRSRRRH